MATVDVLLLNADHSPIRVIPWYKAMELILDNKAHLVEEYLGRVIRSASQQWPWPAVVVLKKYIRVASKIRFNRANVLARDRYQCQYCSAEPQTRSGNPDLQKLTLDHIVPRAQSKNGYVVLPWNNSRVAVTCWENIVAACSSCNNKKADRTPAQAGLKLLALPRKPNPYDAVRMAMTRVHIPEEWKSYLPEGSGWHGYWDSELDPD